MKKLTILGMVIALLLFSCKNNSDEEDEGGIDFTSHNTDYSILVRNYTSYRLIAFKGDLRADCLIGGIPANATGSGHGLPYDLALFDKTEDFPMILITEDQYEANKNNLASLKNTPFTRVYVFFNKNGDNTHIYEISGALGGNNKLNIINASNSVNVELRLGGVAGETIGYAPAGILNTTLRMADGDYTIFPVFKRYNTFRDVVETVYPSGSGSGYSWFQQVGFGEGLDEVTINLKNELSGINFTNGAAWVYVINQTAGGIQFIEGSQVRRTASGLATITDNRTFQIDMPRVANHYQDSVVVANWKFGPMGFEVSLQKDENDNTAVASVTIERDKMYTVTVTGSHNDGNLKAWISNTSEIPSNDLVGTW